MNKKPPTAKLEQARAPAQLAPNDEAGLSDVGWKWTTPFLIAGGIISGVIIGVVADFAMKAAARFSERPATPPPLHQSRPQPPPPSPQNNPSAHTPPDRDPLSTVKPPEPDKESQLAANEWGQGDVEVIEERPASLVEAIELLPDPPRPEETPLVVAEGISPVLHAYRRSALELAQRHAGEYPRQEVGGILLGIIRRVEGRYRSVVTGIVRADTAIGREASVRFGPDTWVDTLAIRDRHSVYGNEDIWQVVGWYHTHPGFGIFLSSLDVHTHGTFLHPGHIALVIDPKSKEYGTFGWNREQTQPVRLAEDARGAQWKVLLDDAQTLKLLNRLEMNLAELPPPELPADPSASIRLLDEGASPRPGAPKTRPPSPQDKGKPDME